jgi:hypothetical protein
MDLLKIKSILDKYYKGETSLEEEKILKEFFRQQTHLDNTQADQQIMGHFDSGMVSVPAGFEKELMQVIEDEWESESKLRLGTTLKWAGSVAAILIITFAVLLYNGREKPVVIADTYSNPEAAYIKTKQVLVFISKTMNKNSNGLKYLSDANKSINRCKKLNKINETLNSIKNEN